MKQLRNEYAKFIEEIDEALTNLKTLFENAQTESERNKLMNTINLSLEERMRFMKLRDTVAALE